MTDKTLTHIYLLLDRSGSMQSIKTDTEGGFAAFVEEQKRTPGECRVTLAQFDNHYDVVYADRPIADVPALELQPRGSTALLDAMGRSITDAGAKLAALAEDERPDTVIVAIMTDGYENASGPTYTKAKVKSRILQKIAEGWQIVYLGAELNAWRTGQDMGFGRLNALSWSPTPAGVEGVFQTLADSTERWSKNKALTAGKPPERFFPLQLPPPKAS